MLKHTTTLLSYCNWLFHSVTLSQTAPFPRLTLLFLPDMLPEREVENMICPLCQRGQAREFFAGRARNYYQCRHCSLVFVPSTQFLSAENEKKRYDLHQNSPDDAGYRRFLQKFFSQLQPHLNPGSIGLDFGSGPGPTLSLMFEQAGHSMTLYDRFYEPNSAVFEKQYDFITAAEVVEHLHDPKQELERLWSCLKQGGMLGIMTQRVVDRDAFSQWRYKDDLTHVCFFEPGTFTWLARQWDAELTFAERDIVILKKKG